MKVLRRLIVLCFVIVTGLFLGDYLNLPLWPTNFLAASYPVQIKIDLEDVSSDVSELVFARSQYINLVISRPDGQFVRNPPVDSRGFARVVLPRGRYCFYVSIPVVEKNEWYFLTYPPSGFTNNAIEKVHSSESSFSVVLRKTVEVSEELLAKVLQMYLLDADFDSAMVFSTEMNERISDDIRTLLEIQAALTELPVDAYNSILTSLSRARAVLTRYGIPKRQQIIKLNDQVVFINPRYEAVRQSRDRVIQDYFDLMQMLYESGRLVDVFRQWNRLSNNTELINQSMDQALENNQLRAFYETIVSEYSELIPQEVSRNLEQAIEIYETGNLMKARSAFAELLSLVQDLKHMFEQNEDTEQLIIEYVEDIELISEANHAIRMDELERALSLYESVIRPNNLVRERIDETERFMRVRGSKVLSNE
jgi:hypothetical protein